MAWLQNVTMEDGLCIQRLLFGKPGDFIFQNKKKKLCPSTEYFNNKARQLYPSDKLGIQYVGWCSHQSTITCLLLPWTMNSEFSEAHDT